MSKADVIEVEGTVLEKLPNAILKWNWRTNMWCLHISVVSYV